MNRSVTDSSMGRYTYRPIMKCNTPSFPAWRHRFAALKRKLNPIRKLTLCQLEHLLVGLIPVHLLSATEEGCNSRERVFSVRRTFWSFLWQVMTPNTSCREVVRQVQARFSLEGREKVDEDDSAYCQARKRLPRQSLERILTATATAADQQSGDRRWFGRRVIVVDGTTSTLPDTVANQAKFPQSESQQVGCGFPLMKVVAFMSLASGAILDVATGSKRSSELGLFRHMWDRLKAGDILLADDGFSDYATLASLPLRRVDGLCRLQGRRHKDFRVGKKLGRYDRLTTWKKPYQRPRTMTAKQWAKVPERIELRLIRFAVTVPGFRTRQIDLVTTLLDHEAYPAAELAALFFRRWRVELCFRDIKVAMGMEALRCKTPEMAHKELFMFLIAHNLIRCLMGQAARIHHVELERISFKGSVDTVRQYSQALAQARNRKQRSRLVEELSENLARDLLPDRPGRSEPRAVKRRPKPYPLLSKPRRLFKEIPHRSRYRAKPNPPRIGALS